jgi:hypothetical protein
MYDHTTALREGNNANRQNTTGIHPNIVIGTIGLIEQFPRGPNAPAARPQDG